MATDGFGTTLRVLFNSIAFFVLIVLATYIFKYNVIWGTLLLLSAFDQLEDVYFYVTSSRLVPAWFRPIDILLEGILALVGISMFIFGLVYWFTFDSMFFFLWMLASGFMTWSALEDIFEGFTVVKERMSGVTVTTVTNASRFKFFRRL